MEEYAGMAQAFQAQLMSIVVEGVFDRFPTLRIACLEGGWAWLPPFLWRFDKEWKGLQREIPWTKRLPSAYIRDHVRFSLQPIDGPPDSTRMLKLIDQLGADDLLMFSTDYPHWHFDDAAGALPAGLPDPLLRKIMGDNARAFYRLGGDAS
jgi:predicted TIM-barrel fold metal-dependent hydrolase